MAMILSGRYESAKEFYISRWLRIFGPYYVILIAVLLWSAFIGLLFGNWLTLFAYATRPLENNGLLGVMIAAGSNLTIFFQDWVMFLKHDYGTPLGFTSDFRTNKSPLEHYLIIPQCWSVGIEETFYLLAPIVTRLRTRALLILLALSLLARIYAYKYLGVQHDPFTFRFFPFEAAMFLMGILGWRLYVRLDLGNRFPTCPGGFSYVIACVLLAVGFYLNAALIKLAATRVNLEYVLLLSYLLWSVTIIFLFAYFRKHTVDRFIGELCFPIYLLHLVVIQTIDPAFMRLGISQAYLGKASALATIGISIIFYIFFLRPFDRWRHAYIVKRRRIKTADHNVLANPVLNPDPLLR
jgi:peptidoglycan/LPS O-acetylase OafA/YrhL